MIGFYDYTIVLTLLSLVASIFGMTQAVEGQFKVAIICLAFSGLCDAFDGKVARTKKNRSDEESLFGIQLDSLCDMVCFGACPALICYLLGVRGYVGCIAISYYCICSIIRLSYYNVIETNRMNMEDPGEKVYYGLPITTISVILPLVFLLELFIPQSVFPAVLVIMLFVVGTCFILNFTLKKPSMALIGVAILVGLCAIIIMCIFSEYNVAEVKDGGMMKHILEGLHDLSKS